MLGSAVKSDLAAARRPSFLARTSGTTLAVPRSHDPRTIEGLDEESGSAACRDRRSAREDERWQSDDDKSGSKR
jgi:hypothetical protein